MYRNGVPIGRAHVQIIEPQKPLGLGVFTLLDGAASQSTTVGLALPATRWMAVDLQSTVKSTDVSQRVKLPPAFATLVEGILHPGTTLMVTDLPATEETKTPDDFTIMASAPRQAR